MNVHNTLPWEGQLHLTQRVEDERFAMTQQFQAAKTLKERLESLPRSAAKIDQNQARQIGQAIDSALERIARELNLSSAELPTPREQQGLVDNASLQKMPQQSREHLAQLVELASRPDTYVAKDTDQKKVERVFRQADESVQQQLSQMGIVSGGSSSSSGQSRR
jgi:hypothetical protein